MSDSDDVVELLPCPFCGKQPTTQDYRSSSDETGEVYGYAGVECHHGKAEGGAVFHFDTLAEAVTAWNTRAALSATPLAQMREALAKARDTFQRYGDLHKVKETCDGHQKAAINYALALEMDEALTGEAP